MELRDERLKKRFELPPFLKHFATNLNLLARQDKLPPVFGRDHEIQQVLEILCHRERANSVMLDRRAGRRQDGDRRRAGAPNRVRAGDRAGPAARLPGRQPADEHDGRGHDASRHVRGSDPERHPRAEGAAEPDSVRRRGAHAWSAPARRSARRRTPPTCFKSVLARGEVRMVAATTLSEYKEYIQEDEALARRFRCVARVRADDRGDAAHPRTTCGRASSGTTRSGCSTKRSRRRSTCRRATCGTCTCPTRSSAGSTRPRSAPRSTAAGK